MSEYICRDCSYVAKSLWKTCPQCKRGSMVDRKFVEEPTESFNRLMAAHAERKRFKYICPACGSLGEKFSDTCSNCGSTQSLVFRTRQEEARIDAERRANAAAQFARQEAERKSVCTICQGPNAETYGFKYGTLTHSYSTGKQRVSNYRTMQAEDYFCRQCVASHRGRILPFEFLKYFAIGSFYSFCLLLFLGSVLFVAALIFKINIPLPDINWPVWALILVIIAGVIIGVRHSISMSDETVGDRLAIRQNRAKYKADAYWIRSGDRV